jgi:hypothetical protein
MKLSRNPDPRAPTRTAPAVSSYVVQCFLAPSFLTTDPALGTMRLLRLDAEATGYDAVATLAKVVTHDVVLRPALGDGTPNFSVPAMHVEDALANQEGFRFPYMLWVGSAAEAEEAAIPPWERHRDSVGTLPAATSARGAGDGALYGGAHRCSTLEGLSRVNDGLQLSTTDDGVSNGDAAGVAEYFGMTERRSIDELSLPSPTAGTMDSFGKPPFTPSVAARRQKRQKREEERRKREALAAKREEALKAREVQKEAEAAIAKARAEERELEFEQRAAEERRAHVLKEERRSLSRAQQLRMKMEHHADRMQRLGEVKEEFNSRIVELNKDTPMPAVSPATSTLTQPRPMGISTAAARPLDGLLQSLDETVARDARASAAQQAGDKAVMRAKVDEKYLEHLVQQNTQRKTAVLREQRAKAAEAALANVEFVSVTRRPRPTL